MGYKVSKGHLIKKGKQYLALLLSICLIGTMIPITARAQTEGTQVPGYEQEEENVSVPQNDTQGSNSEPGDDPAASEDEPTCTCSERCTEDHRNLDCPVCGKEGADLNQCEGKEETNSDEQTKPEEKQKAECTCSELCTEDHTNTDCPVCGADDADLYDCKGKSEEKDEVKDETARIITAWKWIDEEGYLDEETGNLAIPGASKEKPAHFSNVTEFLPTKIMATVENAEEPIILGDWNCEDYPEKGAYTGSYTFTAALPEGYVLSKEAKALTVTLELGGAQMYEISQPTGDFTVTGGECGTDYTYAGGVLTIKSGEEIRISGTTTTDTIVVERDKNANIILDGVNIDVSSSRNTAAFKIEGYSAGNVTITLADGSENTLKSGDNCAGLQKNRERGSLTIQGDTGTLTATGGEYGAGIGGGRNQSGSNITISDCTVTATGGEYGAGIGGGAGGSGSGIIINGGTVTATSGEYGAGIGGGYSGSGSNITISDGTVTATGGNNGAGIGGGGSCGSGSNITISGGTVTATGGEYGAGIGGGIIGSGSNITISGGTVTATGGEYGAGIGGGDGGSGSDITISGDTVTATGGNFGAGIGGGNGGSGSNITISDDTVTATGGKGGAGIGGGYNASGSNIKIRGGSVKAVAGEDANAIGGGRYKDVVLPTNGTNEVYLLTIDNPDSATVYIDGNSYSLVNHKAVDSEDTKLYAYLTGAEHRVQVGNKIIFYTFDSVRKTFAVAPFSISGALTYDTDYTYTGGVLTIKSATPITIANTDPSTATTTDRIEVADGVSANITLAGVNISSAGYPAFKIADNSTGNVTIILKDGTENTLKGGTYSAGLQKNGNVAGIGKLTIKGGTEGTGKLEATGSKNSGAGIGGHDGKPCSNIEISGGTVTATGGDGGAGIGGGYNASGSDITISDGIVTATSRERGAGIGGGAGGSGSDITISGGTVTATGGNFGAGIGGGRNQSGSNITISDGTVTATGGGHGAGIGGGDRATGSDITISGGTVTATGGYGGAGIGGGDGGSGSDITISGGSVKAVAGKDANAIGGGRYKDVVLPTNGTNEVYLLTIDNPDSATVYIDGNSYSLDNHKAVDSKDTKLYAYLTGAEHRVQVGNKIILYTFDSERKTFAVAPFSISGALTYDTDYTYTGGVLTIKSATPITIANTDPSTATTTDRIEVADGVSADITLAGVNIDVSSSINTAPFKIADNSAGNVIITLADDSKNTLKSGDNCAGLQKNGGGGSLTIQGNTGKLTATGGAQGAGIGGGKGSSGSNITISGGTVTATGGSDAAGIGGGQYAAGSNIIISDGTVTATGGGGGAGIGGGNKGSGSNITISDGTVTATGKGSGAGIGGSDGRSGSDITISGGTVTATGGDDGGAGIGGGGSGSGSNIKISGGSVKAVAREGANAIGGGKGQKAYIPTLADGTTQVYLFKIDNNSGADIKINHTAYPTNHMGEGKIYAYLPAKTVADPNVVTVGTETTKYIYDTNNTKWLIVSTAPVIAPTPNNSLVYTGAAQDLVTAGTTSYGTMVYSLDENGTYTTAIPTGRDADTYTVWYKVKDGEVYADTEPARVSVTIEKATPVITNAGTVRNQSTVYGSGDFVAPITNNVAGTVEYSADGQTYNADGLKTYLAGKNVSDSPVAVVYTFTPRDTKNYYSLTTDMYMSFTITQATPEMTWGTTSQSATYTGTEIVTSKLTPPNVTLKNSESYSGTFTYSYRAQGSSAAFTSGLPTERGTYEVKASIAADGNYTAAETESTMTLTVDWLTTSEVATLSDQGDNPLSGDSWWAQRVSFKAPNGYTISHRVEGTYGASFDYDTQTGAEGETVTYYLKNSDGEIAQKTATVRIDRTAPAWPAEGGISVKENWWKSLLNTISFGLFYKEATVDVKASATDSLSGVAAYYYYVDETGSTRVLNSDELAKKPFTKIEGTGTQKLTSLDSENQYVVYAYAVDQAGNKSGYVCTEGVVLDRTAPTISGISTPSKEALTLTDTSATISFTGSEAGTCFYRISGTVQNDITAFATSSENSQGMTVWTAKTGVSSVDMTTEAKQITLSNLNPNTTYTLYLAAVDKAGNSTETTVYSQTFKTCKTMPKITVNPAISGTYGQKVEEMPLTDGTAKVGSEVITGTWAVTDSNKANVPVVGTTATYQVTFTPADTYGGKYDTVIVTVKPTVAPRSLGADEVSITEVAGSFTYDYGTPIKPAVSCSTGSPASGIYVSDRGAMITTNDIKVTYANNINAGEAKVTLTGQGNYTGTVTKNFTIDKANGKAVASMDGSYTDNGQTYTYRVEAVPAGGTDVNGLEYLMLPQGTSLTGSETWQTSGVFAGITPNTVMVFYARMKATANNHAGAESSKTVTFKKLTPPMPALNFTVDSSDPDNITVTIVPVSGAEYSFNGGGSWTDENTKDHYTIDDEIQLAIRIKETATHNASDTNTLTTNLTTYDITVANGSAAVNGNMVTKGYPGQTVTVTAATRSGYNVSGFTVVSGGMSLTVSADKKTATFTMPAEAVSLKAEYQKIESGSGGGSGNSGGSTDTGEGNTNPGTLTPRTSPAPGMVNNLNAGGGLGIQPGNTGTGVNRPDAGKPYIRDQSGKEGWDAIKDEVNHTQEGRTVTVDMNGSTVVSGDVLNEIKGKDIMIVFDMGGGITWSVNGQSITDDRIGNIDFSVTVGTNAIPVDIINNVTGEHYSQQISLAYDGEFGFTAVLSINMEAGNAGLYANLFYYNERIGELEFICADEIAADGRAELVFTHASDYAIVVDTRPMDSSVDAVDSDSKAEASETGNGSTQTGNGSTQSGTEAADSRWNPLWLILIGAVVIVIGLGVFFIVKKKKPENE